MENQPIANSPETTLINSAPISQTPVTTQAKTNLLIPILTTALVSAIIFGLGGYYLGKQSLNNFQQSVNNQNQPVVTNIPEVSPTQYIPSPSITSTPISLKTYTSKLEKLSFKYPSDWKEIPYDQSNLPGGDSFKIQSPNGKLEVVWVAGMDGLGGGCDETAVLGSPDGCPLMTIVEKQKLANVDLYYVAYLETHDGVNYYPGMALIDSTGTLTTRRAMNYMLFKGKNNGGAATELGVAPVAKNTVGESEAKAFLITPEAIQAKNILLSATY
jgi:hypothetical protein